MSMHPGMNIFQMIDLIMTRVEVLEKELLILKDEVVALREKEKNND